MNLILRGVFSFILSPVCVSFCLQVGLAAGMGLWSGLCALRENGFHPQGRVGIGGKWWWWWWFSCSVMSDSATPRTVAHQAPLSMGFPRQRHWSGLPFPSPRDLLDRELIPVSCTVGGFFTAELPGKPQEGALEQIPSHLWKMMQLNQNLFPG